jgi:hypothetical protein
VREKERKREKERWRERWRKRNLGMQVVLPAYGQQFQNDQAGNVSRIKHDILPHHQIKKGP